MALDLNTLLRLAVEQGQADTQPIALHMPPPMDPLLAASMSIGIPGGGPMEPVQQVPSAVGSGNPGFAERIGLELNDAPVSFRPTGNVGQNAVAQFLTSMANQYGRSTARSVTKREQLDEALKKEAAAKNERNIALSDAARTLAQQRHDRAREMKMGSDLRIKEDVFGSQIRQQEGEAKKVATPFELRRLGYPQRMSPSDIESLMKTHFPERYRAAYGTHGGVAGLYDQSDPEAVALAIYEGRQSPDLSQYGRMMQGAVASVLEKKYRFDLATALTGFRAQQQFYRSNNTALPLRLRQSLENASSTVDAAEEALGTLEQEVPRFGPTSLNKIVQISAKEGLGNDTATAAAQSLASYVNALQFELANIYQGGGVPTDQAQKKASSIINEFMGPVRLRAAIAAARREIGWRRLATTTAGPVTPTNPSGVIAPPAPSADAIHIMVVDGKRKKVPESRMAEFKAAFPDAREESP